MKRHSVLQRSSGVAAARESGSIGCDAGRGIAAATNTATATFAGQVSCFAVGVDGVVGCCDSDDGACRHTQAAPHLQQSRVAPLLAAQQVRI